MKLRPSFKYASAERPQKAEKSYSDFKATELYCSKCRRAVPVKERHLLYLPAGDLYDYVCSVCGTSVGSRKTEE